MSGSSCTSNGKNNMLEDTCLDIITHNSAFESERGIGIQNCICCAPRCCMAPPNSCNPCCKPQGCTGNRSSGSGKQCCGPPCGPCGAFGPVKCPCELNCAPKGTHCCVIRQPDCCLSVPGCQMCNNGHCLPRQPTWSPRCCTMP